jgi:hypothetical protein
MPFQKGQSGNAKGRPPKNRTLTAILEKAGNAKRIVGDKPVASKKMVADLLWEAAATGKITEADGTVVKVEIDDRIGIIRFLYQHIDGPPRSEVEVSGAGGGPINHKVDHAIDSGTATNIFDILAAAGAIQPFANDAKDDGLHTT